MKANYRKSTLHSLLAAVGKFNTATEFAKFVTVFDAIRWISSAGNNVQEETILKFFRRAGFASPETDLQEHEDSISESDLISALPEALQFEVASNTTFWKTKQIFLCMKTSHPLLRAFWKT